METQSPPFQPGSLSRRDFIRATGLLALLPVVGCPQENVNDPRLVNDIHSQLNPTRVDSIVAPDSLQSLQAAITEAERGGKSISIAAARHAMGGQQFAGSSVLIDSTRLKRVLSFDREKGLVEVEAGIAWPELIEYLAEVQKGADNQWGIAQKQTGADRLCVGGAVSANAHGRGLKMRPFISDIEAFTLVDAKGNERRCSRKENAELFRLAIGGYGLFGVIYSVKLRLVPRCKVQRVVEMTGVEELTGKFDRRIGEGCLYGDFQFSTDEKSADFLNRGIISCYRPVSADTPIPHDQKQVSERAWAELVYLAHSDKARAYRLYTDYYLASSGQVYWSDYHQLGAYIKDYHLKIDKRLRAAHPATEVITEIYVPRGDLAGFLKEVAKDFRDHGVNLIYGTVRLIEKDTESFLAWAKQSYACVIFNLHTEHTPEGKEHSARAFRRLIDMAIARGGSYYLTYHRHATRKQVEACYPQFEQFLQLKKKYDPQERFQSDWYRHYKQLFAMA